MSKNTGMKETARKFRELLTCDLANAASLLAKHRNLIDCPVFGKSESALHFFAVENRLDVVSWLLSHGANPDGIANDDFPLHAAAQLGHREVCQALLQAGANPDLRDSVGETALHKASRAGHLEVIDSLLISGADPSIRGMCGELPIDQVLPRKRDQVRALLDRSAIPSNQAKTIKGTVDG